jgi:hypothetical protein
MMIRMMLMEYRVGGVCAAIVYSVILWQSSRFSGVRLGGFCYRIARYVSIALGVEFFGTSGTVEVVGVQRLFALCVGIALWL